MTACQEWRNQIKKCRCHPLANGSAWEAAPWQAPLAQPGSASATDPERPMADSLGGGLANWAARRYVGVDAAVAQEGAHGLGVAERARG